MLDACTLNVLISSLCLKSIIYNSQSVYLCLSVFLFFCLSVCLFLYMSIYSYLVSLSTVLMVGFENCLEVCFPIVNLLTSPLIMYSKFMASQIRKSICSCYKQYLYRVYSQLIGNFYPVFLT